MSLSIHKQATINCVKLHFEKNRKWGEILTEATVKLNDGFYDQGLVDMIMQKPEGQPYDLYDAYDFLQILTSLDQGAVLLAKIHLGIEPAPNSAVKANNRALSTLWPPFRAKFQPETGRGDNDDGAFYWDEPIALGQRLPNGQEVECQYPKWRAPLEVGTTEASRSFLHLAETGWLARWPYGSPIIYLLHKHAPNLWSVGAALAQRDPWDDWTPPFKP